MIASLLTVQKYGVSTATRAQLIPPRTSPSILWICCWTGVTEVFPVVHTQHTTHKRNTGVKGRLGVWESVWMGKQTLEQCWEGYIDRNEMYPIYWRLSLRYEQPRIQVYSCNDVHQRRRDLNITGWIHLNLFLSGFGTIQVFILLAKQGVSPHSSIP